jgi:hypothetical protein
LDALKGLEAARKYMCQVDTKNNITVMCRKLKMNYTNQELKEKRNMRLAEWLKK